MRSTSSRRRATTAAAALAAVAISILAGCSTQDDTASRQATVASRGAEVMPFDLDATTHTFTQTGTGGRQLVTADDPSDQNQIDLIRQHLQTERTNFANGDFSDPARIHGMDMPGVAELSAGYTRITVTYTERSDGAELTYATDDPALIDAIHAWFDRQVMDHGDHATTG
jgi:hypothetical protein